VIESLDSIVCGAGALCTDFCLCAHQVALEHTQPLVFNVVSNGRFAGFDFDALLNVKVTLSAERSKRSHASTIASATTFYNDRFLIQIKWREYVIAAHALQRNLWRCGGGSVRSWLSVQPDWHTRCGRPANDAGTTHAAGAG
jgi:hypothetical protein